MKRRISPSRYTSTLYSDITGYRGAAIDVSQSLYLLRDVLKQLKLSDTPVKSFGWDWPAMTLGEVVGRCITADSVLYDAVEVTRRVEQGIEQSEVCSRAAGVLFDAATFAAGFSGSSPNSERVAIHYHAMRQWAGVGVLLSRIKQRQSPVEHMKLVRARATLREAERMSKRRQREGG
jgi:hypothetical protein